MSTTRNWPGWAKVLVGLLLFCLVVAVVAMVIAAFTSEDAEAAVDPTWAKNVAAYTA